MSINYSPFTINNVKKNGCGKWGMVNNVNNAETIISHLGMVNIPSIYGEIGDG